MKVFVYFLILYSLSSCSKEFILRSKIEGNIHNNNNIPIKNAKLLFIDCLNSDCNGEIPNYTNENGTFTIEKEIKTYLFMAPSKSSRPFYSYNLVVSKDGYISDTLDIREYKNTANVIYLDSIKLFKIK